jgi:hypothetical protein
MAAEPFRIPVHHGHATLDDATRAALRRRFEAASVCLIASPIHLPWKFLAELAPMLHPPSLRELPAPPAETPFLNQIFAGLARGIDPESSPEFARHLAAAMFYFFPHELPLTPAPSQLPLWIRVPYLKWSLARPQCFHNFSEAFLYDRWLEEFRKVIAGEFAEGGGLEDLPEYQRPRLRRLVEQ